MVAVRWLSLSLHGFGWLEVLLFPGISRFGFSQRYMTSIIWIARNLGGCTGRLHFQRPDHEFDPMSWADWRANTYRTTFRAEPSDQRRWNFGTRQTRKSDGSLHWVELARVTERRRMAQLALWDKSGTRRVLVDQQFENFAVIRSRILTEYAKVFALKPLPIEFRNSSPLLLESFVFGSVAAFCSWGSWSTYQQGQAGLSVILLCFAVHPSCLEIESSYAPFSKQKTSTKKAFPGSSWQMSQIHGVAPNFRLSF